MYKYEDLYAFVQAKIKAKMNTELHAVLVADVIASRARGDVRVLLGKKLEAASQKHLREKFIRLPYAVTAGDEFQTLTDNLPAIPALLLDLRAALQPLTLRVGIGFGSVADRIQPPVNRLTGEAFQMARGAIENIKASGLFKFEILTAFASHDEDFDQTINLLYGLHDTLLLRVTAKQWEAIRRFRDQPLLEQAAKRLKLDVSTVSRNLKRGYYWQLSETVKAVGVFIERTFGKGRSSALAD